MSPRDSVLTARNPRCSPSRPLYLAFAELPNPQEYPDYYKMLKKPISFKEVKEKLDTCSSREISDSSAHRTKKLTLTTSRNCAVQYRSFPDFKTDLNQIFVNAKRYNAPGSPIFLDAKYLHKILKDTYAVMTGEVEPSREPEEDDAPEPVAVETPGGAAEESRGDDIKRATQLKPWLLKKLNQTTSLRAPDGRRLADQFEKLPDRNLWPDYYQIISSPQAFSTVKYRTTHRYYATAASFIEDVNLIFDNALYYNEESSGIAQDAIAMKRHFAQVMREPPPQYVPPREPRKYTKRDPEAKARQKQRQQSATPVAATSGAAAEADQSADYDPHGDDYESDDGDSRHGSVVPDGVHGYNTGRPDGLHPQQQQQHHHLPADPFALPGSAPVDPSALDASHALNGGGGLAGTASTTTTTFGQPDPSSTGLYAPIAGVLNASPNVRTGGVALRPDLLYAAPPAVDQPRVPRHVARLPNPGEVPLVSRIEVTLSSSATPAFAPKPIVLDNSDVRQHSLSVPFGTDRVEIALRFAAASDAKGKAKAENGFASSSSSSSSDDPPPQVTTAVARPSTLSLVEITELPPAAAEPPPPPPPAVNGGGLDLSVDGTPSGGGALVKRYSLTPRVGLSVVEFLVRPGGVTGVAEAEEVFRLFITR